LISVPCATPMSSGITTPFGELFLSPGYITYALLTRPPLTLGLGYPKPRFVRLACLSHAASVRSEPGSNSPVVIRQRSEPARKTGPTRCLRTDSFDRPCKDARTGPITRSLVSSRAAAPHRRRGCENVQDIRAGRPEHTCVSSLRPRHGSAFGGCSPAPRPTFPRH
jgi:hypothetical protein